jgi:hypothetical protein
MDDVLAFNALLILFCINGIISALTLGFVIRIYMEAK